jgi:hypothetical protein
MAMIAIFRDAKKEPIERIVGGASPSTAKHWSSGVVELVQQGGFNISVVINHKADVPVQTWPDGQAVAKRIIELLRQVRDRNCLT